MTSIFTQPDTWYGGFYALNLELIDKASDTRQKTLAAIWNVPQLNGFYERKDIEPQDQKQVTDSNLYHEGHIYSIALLPNDHLCACGIFMTDYEQDGTWVEIYLPFGALSEHYSLGGYPFGQNSPALADSLKILNQWFREIGEAIYRQAQFQIGIIGFESDCITLKEQVTVSMPTERWEGFLMPKGEQLEWFPPTELSTQFT